MITSELYDLIHTGDLKKTRSCLESKPDLLNSYVDEGYTPLHIACAFGQEDVATFLVDRLALLNLPADNPSRATPLHLAVSFRIEDVALRLVNLLVSHGAELNAKQEHGQTPLHHAVARGSLKLVTELVMLGADPFLKDDQGQSPADLAKRLEEQGDNPAMPLIREALKRAFSLPLS